MGATNPKIAKAVKVSKWLSLKAGVWTEKTFATWLLNLGTHRLGRLLSFAMPEIYYQQSSMVGDVMTSTVTFTCFSYFPGEGFEVTKREWECEWELNQNNTLTWSIIWRRTKSHMKSCQRLIISLYDKANLNLVYYKEIALEFISQKFLGKQLWNERACKKRKEYTLKRISMDKLYLMDLKDQHREKLFICTIPDICHRHHRRCLCKKILPGVIFFRLNAKNCHFTV